MLPMDNREMKESSRRTKKVKNLEEEVEFILSQDESDGDCNSTKNKNEIFPKTPSQDDRTKNIATPKSSQIVLQELLQTPRRSCRKSIKPTQDYEEIVNKSLRFSTRSVKKNLLATEKKEDEGNEDETAPPKWSTAEVGRVSKKRGRKSRRTAKPIKQDNNETIQLLEETINEEKGDTKDVKEARKSFSISATEKIIDQNNQVNKIEENTIELNVKNDNGKDIELLKEVTNIEKNDLIVKEMIKENQVDEIVDNMEHLNVKNENDGQKRKEIFTQGQQEADNEKRVLKDEPIHLIQEDSEDCQEFSEKSKEQEICIVYECNISNREINEESEDELQSHSQIRNSQGNNVAETFGCYLKSKDLNISDLGLNPIKDEEEKDLLEESHENKSSTRDVDEMPSLILCDDDDEIDVKACNKLNATFDANNSVIVIEDVEKNFTKPTEEVMESLQMSDDCETPRKRPRIVLTDTELINKTILSTPREPAAIKVKLPSTPKALSTPKQSKKPFRFPTPYRNKQSFKFNKEIKENVTIKTPSKNQSNASMISLTTLEPKEIVLQGIRKRSLSVCINGNEHKRQKLLTGSLAKVKSERVVSFYSPANQTTIIDDLDVQISKSLKKKNIEEKDALNKFVTTRRKRSLSLDDSIMANSLLSKLPRPVPNQNVANKIQTSSSTSKPLLRTKLPNFSAIHQKHFQKMENLVDHVQRKQERSNNLINSSTKLRPVSAKKNISITKKSENISTEKSKALKKIDFVSKINRSQLNTTATTAAPINTQKVLGDKVAINLPEPRLGATKVIKTAPISHRLPQQQENYKYLKPSQVANIENTRLNTKKATSPKAAFNLSTSLMVKPTKSSSRFAQNANTSHMFNDDKMASRLQRHMDLFKGRVPTTRSGGVLLPKNEILKGVRSNRRFELQMKHRKNLEQ